MRIWHHFCLVLISCSLFAWRFSPTQPGSEEQRKGQALADAYYGRGHAQVTVTVCYGRGERSVRDTQLGERAFVVSSQHHREACAKKYINETQAEKLELPRKIVVTQQQEWVEHTDVAVVVDREPGPEIKTLLQAGLGLDLAGGDQIQVVRSQR